MLPLVDFNVERLFLLLCLSSCCCCELNDDGEDDKFVDEDDDVDEEDGDDEFLSFPPVLSFSFGGWRKNGSWCNPESVLRPLWQSLSQDEEQQGSVSEQSELWKIKAILIF